MNRTRPAIVLFSLLAVLPLSAADLPVEKARLTSPPHVPPPIERNHSAKVIVNVEVIEKTMRLADGVEYVFWTFGGTTPGSFIRIREGDQVELNLHNHPDNKLPHNIDLHAVTGQGGGAEGSFTAPGRSSRFNFKALNPGLFVYHCATQPVGLHVANGMYGLILVEPKNGLSKVDREYYVFRKHPNPRASSELGTANPVCSVSRKRYFLSPVFLLVANRFSANRTIYTRIHSDASTKSRAPGRRVCSGGGGDPPGQCHP